MWTDEQLRAINETGSNILVSAAAGSGKTAVLVERILRIICDSENCVDIDKLLVLTFTKAAAAQMRERINKRLQKKAEDEPENVHIQRQIALINRASIMTIDSFCLKIVKENYMSIDLDPAVRMADEKECDLIKNDILEELIEEKYSDENNDSFLGLIEMFSEETGDNRLKELILSVHEFIQSDPFPKQWLKTAAENFNVSSESYINESAWGKIVVEMAEMLIDGAVDICESAMKIMEAEGGLPESYMDAICQYKYFLTELKKNVKEDYNKAVESVQKFIHPEIGRIKPKVHDSELAKRIKDMRDEVKSVINDIKNNYLFEYSATAIEDIRAMYPYMKELTETVLEFDVRYKAAKIEKTVVDFSVMEHYALEILL